MICYFYGSQGVGTASAFRAGTFVEQNNAELNRSGLSLVEAGTIYNLPKSISNQRVRRYDLAATLPYKNIRTYSIRTLQDAPVSLFGN